MKEVPLRAAGDREGGDAQRSQGAQKLNHPHIIAYKEAFVSASDNLQIVMEYAQGGDMGRSPLPPPRQLPIAEKNWSDTCGKSPRRSSLPRTTPDAPRPQACQYLLDQNSNVKLGDFGISKILPFSLAKAMTQIGRRST